MSFAGDVKTELCRAPLSRKCCAQAEAYGVLLYCNTFTSGEVRIVTESEAFAQRLPPLFKRAFKLTFDRLPQGGGKQVFEIATRPSWRSFIRPSGPTPGRWPSMSTLPWWRRTAAGRPSSGGPFWPEGR